MKELKEKLELQELREKRAAMQAKLKKGRATTLTGRAAEKATKFVIGYIEGPPKKKVKPKAKPKVKSKAKKAPKKRTQA